LTGLQYLSGQNILYNLSVKIFVEKGSKEGANFVTKPENLNLKRHQLC
jgi:hypothetical protein